MIFRKATCNDIEFIMTIIKQAQKYLKSKGINQWQNNYPNKEIIESDIKEGSSHVLINNNKIIATVALSFSGEKTYQNIYNGEWLTNGRYAVIHRIAVENNYKGKGIFSIIIDYAVKICFDNNVYSIKIDTHEENESMKKTLINNGFLYCGIIYLEDGAKRLAYEKIF